MGTKPQRVSKIYWLAVLSVVCIFIVNTLGFTDTITGSAMGCGRNWPLCNGQVIPSVWNSATLIEYTHRISVIVGGVVMIWLSVAAWRAYGHMRSIRVLVIAAMLGVFLEGALGALAVLFVNPPAVMAAHMGIALISFAAMVLIAGVIRREESTRLDPSAVPIMGDATGVRRFRRLAIASVIYGYVAIYVGAYVASTGDGGSFQGWPFPTEVHAGSAFWIDVLHRSVAFGFVLWMVILVILSRRFKPYRSNWFYASWVALILVVLQAVTGGILIATHLSTVAFLLHVTNVSLLFATQCYLGFEVARETVRWEIRSSNVDQKAGIGLRLRQQTGTSGR